MQRRQRRWESMEKTVRLVAVWRKGTSSGNECEQRKFQTTGQGARFFLSPSVKSIEAACGRLCREQGGKIVRMRLEGGKWTSARWSSMGRKLRRKRQDRDLFCQLHVLSFLFFFWAANDRHVLARRHVPLPPTRTRKSRPLSLPCSGGPL
jgi:hypothetical protein